MFFFGTIRVPLPVQQKIKKENSKGAKIEQCNKDS